MGAWTSSSVRRSERTIWDGFENFRQPPSLRTANAIVPRCNRNKWNAYPAAMLVPVVSKLSCHPPSVPISSL